MKTMIQMVPSMPVKSNAERKRLRPVGRNVEKYVEIIDGMVDIVKACDELGYWGMSFIEHHFHKCISRITAKGGRITQRSNHFVKIPDGFGILPIEPKHTAVVAMLPFHHLLPAIRKTLETFVGS